MAYLHFGTDGWRDIIARRFNFDNVSRAAQGYANHLLAAGKDSVLVGYDTRFMGAQFARRVAEVLAANGLTVLLSDNYLPTPALSFAVTHYQAAGGVMLTASHNPAEYHGFKLKGAYGGTATPAIYQDVSKRVNALSTTDVPAFHAHQHKIAYFNIQHAYYDALAKLIDIDVLSQRERSVIHESMGGAATRWLSGFMRHLDLPIEVFDLRSEAHPLFYGVNPEPIAQNLHELSSLMQHVEVDFATATDGDGDRLGVMLPGGVFFNSHQIFAVLLQQLHRKGLPGKVVKTFTVSRIIERLAAVHQIPYLETPVGFKHIVAEMLADEVLIGGEESGGIGIHGHIPERDGIANSLLLLEAVASTGQSVAELFRHIEDETQWQHHYDRLDLHLDSDAHKDDLLHNLQMSPPVFAGQEVQSVETLDGVKLNLDDAWLLFRPSGTEPLFRVYCEASSDRDVQAILHAAQRFVSGFAAVS